MDRRRGSADSRGFRSRTYFFAILLLAVVGGHLVFQLNGLLSNPPVVQSLPTEQQPIVIESSTTAIDNEPENDDSEAATDFEPRSVNIEYSHSARISKSFLDRNVRRIRGFPQVIHILQVVKTTGVGISANPGWATNQAFGVLPLGTIVAASKRKRIRNIEHYQLGNFRWFSSGMGQNAKRIRSILVPHGVMRRVKFPTSIVCQEWLETNSNQGFGTPEYIANATLYQDVNPLASKCSEEVAVYREVGRLLNELGFLVNPDQKEEKVELKTKQILQSRTRTNTIEVSKAVADAKAIQLLPPHGFKKASLVDNDECEQNVFFLPCAHSPDCTWRQDRGACYKDVNSRFAAENFKGEYDPTMEFSPHRIPPTFRPIPRSSKVKYFLYQPSGGYNNQRLEMQTALIAARLLNRTAILPHIAAHTNIFTNYNKQPPERMVPVQLILNVQKMRSVVDCVTMPLGMNIPSFVSAFKNGFTWRTETKAFSKPLSEKGAVKVFGGEEADILYFANSSMWQSFSFKGTISSHPDRYYVQTSMMYTDRIKRTALRIAKWLGNYHCAHVRVGDTRTTHQKNMLSGQWYAKRLAKYANETTRVYIATDERNEDYFEAMAKYNLHPLFAKDIPRNLIEPHLRLFPERMYFDMLGTVEQLICTYANKFIGTFYSTFTMTILMFRKYRPLIGPIDQPRPGDPTVLPPHSIGNTTCDHFRAWYTTTAC